MGLEHYTVSTIITTLGTAGFGMFVTVIITWLTSRKRTNAETVLAKAQTKLTEIEAYSKMLSDVRAELNAYMDKQAVQDKQLNNQAQQITNLQNQNTEYLKIINAQNRRESALQKRIKQLESELSRLKNQFQIS